ncbi:hypothetical protein N7528_002852 [Penicillium herquei]|nr:hypothetical protein N7528_002852 [Penicillium herquei]
MQLLNIILCLAAVAYAVPLENSIKARDQCISFMNSWSNFLNHAHPATLMNVRAPEATLIAAQLEPARLDGNHYLF